MMLSGSCPATRPPAGDAAGVVADFMIKQQFHVHVELVTSEDSTSSSFGSRQSFSITRGLA